jgi:hypothetical protein
MKLELNLVKSPQIDSRTVKFLARNRYEVASEPEVMDAIQKFIADNISTFTAALTNQRLVAQLEQLKDLTVSQFQGLRYILAMNGLDIWYFAVKEGEVNESEVPDDIIEYTILDNDQMSYGFIPMAFRFVQPRSEMSISAVYQEIVSAFGLFEGSFYVGMKNPLKASIDTVVESEKILGVAPKSSTTYINSILEYLHKDMRAITN